MKIITYSPLPLLLLSTVTVHGQTQAPDEAPVFTLDAIVVTAELPSDATQVNKLGLPILDTPQSVSVINDELIESQQANSLEDILKNDASISNKGHFGAQSFFTARGFELNSGENYLRNGLKVEFFDSPPVEILESVEILKGPAAFLYGPGAPGGMINFVTKKPQDEDFVHATAQLGSWDYYRFHGDANKAASDTGSISYRLNVAIENSQDFIDHNFLERQLIDAVTHWQINERSDADFFFTYQHSDQPQDTGLVAKGDSVIDLPRSTDLNQKWTRTEVDAIDTGISYRSALAYDWHMQTSVQYQYVYRDRILSNLVPVDEDNDIYRYNISRRLDYWNSINAVSDFTRDIRLFNLDQKILVGANFAITEQDARDTPVIASDPFDLNDIPTLPRPPLDDFLDAVVTHTYNAGLYVQDVIFLHPKWELILGARFDDYTVHSDSFKDDSVQNTSPHAALLFKPRDHVSTYISYTEGFEFNAPVTNTNAVNFGESLKPTRSEQIELGSKVELFDQRLLLTAALFDILRYNQPVAEDIPDAEPGEDIIIVQRGEQHHQGLEVAAAGALTKQWSVFSSIMWLDAKFSSDNEVDIAGNRPASVPEFSASLWTEYRFDKARLRHWSVNSGLYYEGKRYGDDQNSFVLDPYTRVDAGVGYQYPLKTKKLDLRLNVENIFDVDYFQAFRRTNVSVGAPRSYWLTLSIS